MNYEVTSFQDEVIAASYDHPVLVDFWAPWCGPCRQLSPVLERLAEEQEDWTLVKVNTDDHSDVARQYGVRGIPAVKLFIDGTVEHEFTGALPEVAVRRWLDEHLPNETKTRVTQARQALQRGDTDSAVAALESVLDTEPDHAEAKILLARALVFEDAARAQQLADEADVADPNARQTREAVQTIARLVLLNDDPSALPDETGYEAYRKAIEALADHDFDAALQHFISVIEINRGYDDDGARKACVALFMLLGENHPVTRAHRRTFDMALY